MSRRDLLAGAAPLALTGEPAAAGAAHNIPRRLGMPVDTKLLIIHADDAGMCHSVNTATMRALTEGAAASASVMVPCPWFPEMAAWSREHPGADLGLHLTLTSEWRRYRWGPTAPRDQVRGLIDEEGYLWRSVEAVAEHASAAEVETELRAQVARARAFGMKPTHLDSHMGALFARQDYLEAYLRVSRDTGIMAMIPRPTEEIKAEVDHLGLDFQALASRLEGQGHVVLDRLHKGLKASSSDELRLRFREFLDSIEPGVTELIVHLAGDDAEIRAVTGNWEARWRDYQLLMEPETREEMRRRQIAPATYAMLSRLWSAGRQGG